MQPKHWIYTMPLRLRSLFRRRQADRELEDELQYHVEQRTLEYVGKGLNPREARRAALGEFRGIARVTEECRDMRKVNFLQDFIQDIRYSSRVIRKHPGFAAVVILTLALGIGANTLVFGVAYGVLLRPLPFPSPQKLVTLWESNPQKGAPQSQVSAGNFYDWQSQNSVFSSSAAYSNWRFNLTGVSEPENINGALVTPDFFSVFGINPLQGRTFRPDEDKSGKDDVVVVSQSLWNRVFGYTARLSGQTLTLNRSVNTIVGIMPSGFGFPSSATEVWMPLSLDETNKQNRDGKWLKVIARLKPNVTIQQAESNLNVIAARLQASYPKSNANWNVVVISLHEHLVGETRTTLLVLLGAVTLLLLLACANIASLLLARGSGRINEIAVRFALGAGRGRLIRQLLTESVSLVAIGDILAVLLAYWAVASIRLLKIEAFPRIQNLVIDGPVIAFTLALSLLVTAIIGLLPAFRASTYESLRSGSNRVATGPAIQRQRKVLVIAQVALAFILLTGAGLLTNSFLRLSHVNPGFQVDQRLSFQLSLPRSRYKTNQLQVGFFSQVLERIGQQVGVLGSGGVSDLPLLGNRMSFKVLLERTGPTGAQTPPEAGVRWATPGYFAAIGMSLLNGRLFSDHDDATAPPVAIVNQSLAKRFWPARDPIGMRVRLEEDPRWFTVVGVVDDIKQETLDSTEGPALYFSYAQKSEEWLNWISIVVHTSGNPRDLARLMREQVLSVDKDQPITEVATLQEHLADSVALPRIRMLVMGNFSLIAFCISVVGIFGMVSYSVTQRSHEIGIRMALGAQPRDVIWQFLGQGLRCTLWGLALGIGGALFLTRALKGFLFGIDPLDGVTFSLVAAILLVVALTACWLPAQRATRIDPNITLRYE